MTGVGRQKFTHEEINNAKNTRYPFNHIIASYPFRLWSSAGQRNTKEAPTRIVTDMLGRKVEIPTKINSLICTGAGTLRMVTYLAQDLVSGVGGHRPGPEYKTSL